MTVQLAKVKLIVDLLEQTTSLQVVSEFLKSKNLRHSAGSWDELYKLRIEPAVNDYALTIDDLIQLLRSVEEYGRQHVLLYKCSAEKAEELMDRGRIKSILDSRHLGDILVEPQVLDQPAEPTIVDVRWASADVDLSLTIKELEQRTFQKLGETVFESDAVLRRYVLVKKRAVNVMKLHRDGLLEIRLASHSGSSYAQDVARFWKHVGELIPRNDKDFRPISFAKAKEKLLLQKEELKAKIRFSDSVLKNENGVTLRAATGGEKADLSQDAGARESMEAFMRYDDAYCEAHNFWFRAVEGSLSREIHVLLSGEVNEFAVTANCSESDYEYVLRELRALNS